MIIDTFYGGLFVADDLDGYKDAEVSITRRRETMPVWLTKEQIKELRDHLNLLLRDDTA